MFLTGHVSTQVPHDVQSSLTQKMLVFMVSHREPGNAPESLPVTFCLGFHILNLQPGVPVPAPSLRSLHAMEVDCLDRAEMEAGTAQFTVVLPGRSSLYHRNISHRADFCTGTTRGTGIRDTKFLVPGMNRPGEEPVRGSVHEPCKQRETDRHLFAFLYPAGDLSKLSISRGKDPVLFFTFRRPVDRREIAGHLYVKCGRKPATISLF
jgi:hypothetical protein